MSAGDVILEACKIHLLLLLLLEQTVQKEMVVQNCPEHTILDAADCGRMYLFRAWS